ncbi:GGDEF domain-containing protein [Maridesulfovibrio sp.]|uniref:sensor domain-containing diguanylate cyclase n=1 Tax=Maridesulfovibrio sp. TaxID=2795000 RepID=UPI002A187B96|nr:GGDEF domain-containing protein [Maridesulfovibrio sp.]
MDQTAHTRKTSRLGLTIGGALLALIFGICAVFMTKQYNAELEKVRQQNKFIAKLVAYHTSDILDSVIQAIRGMHDALDLIMIRDKNRNDHYAHDKTVAAVLKKSREFNPYISDLIITDPKGTPMHWTGKSKPFQIISEEYLKKHAWEIQKNGYYVSEVITGNGSEENPYFGISIGFKDDAGSLQYIYTALIDYSFFKNDFSNLGIPDGTTIALVTTCGNILMHAPHRSLSPANYGKILNAENCTGDNSTFSADSPYTGKHHEVVFAHVDEYPLVAFASTGKEEILAEWQLYLWTIMCAGAILIFLFSYAYILFFRYQKKSLEHQTMLEEQAMMDPLTRLPNRRRFFPILEREFNLARRHVRPLALLLIDIDHFKRINDRYGHDRGDIVLAAIADTIKKTGRETDISCRMGGEEFALMLSDTGFEGAKTAAEKMRTKIEKLQIEVDGMLLSATVSIGISCYENGDSTPKDLVIRADAALYKAKHIGRNNSSRYTGMKQLSSDPKKGKISYFPSGNTKDCRQTASEV